MRGLAVAAALVCGAAQADGITAARYTNPTDVYAHGAVPGGEYLTLEVMVDGAPATIGYENAVFEDTAPRLVDLNGDGAFEVVTVVSDFDRGARIQIFGLVDGQLAPILANDPIGTRHRWLAIAGIADLDGDGVMEIAYVDRPHLAKVLRIARVTPLDATTWQIEEVASAPGYTNHKYRDPVIEGGVFDCGAGPVIVTANANWSRVLHSQLRDGQIVSVDAGPYIGPVSLEGCG